MTPKPTLTHLLSDLTPFSRHLIRLPLFPYQLQPLQAILDSIRGRHGREFLLIFPRQSGKNEALAQLLVYLLNLLQRRGGSIVYGATGDGLGRGIRRLEERLDNPLNLGRWKKSASPTTRSLGRASVIFMSTHPQAATRGETAHWLLVIDELQDQDPHHLEAVFEPMRAANNATAVYIGTVRSTSDALWLKKQELELLQDQDGCQRVWTVDPSTVIDQNPAYGRFLSGKIAKLGRDHPIVASEYHNTPLQADGGLFDRRRLQLMQGAHSRQSTPDTQTTYIATLDVAGIDEAATDPVAQLANPGRDYTVAHIFQALPDPEGGPPTYLARDIFVDHGTRHFEDAPGRPSLAASLLAWLQHWNVAHLVGDNTGIGAGLVSWLTSRFPADHVTGYSFTRQSKAKLGSNFIAVVETGRFRYWSDQADSYQPRPLSDSWWFFRQAEACTYHLPPGGLFDRDLQWGVPASAKISTPSGRQPIHDDRLLSAALVAVFDDLYTTGHLRLGRAHSAIIPAADPLDNLSF